MASDSIFDIKKILAASQLDQPYVVVLRHAQKVTDNLPSHFDCKLTKQGEREAEKLGEYFSRMAVCFDLIRSSPVPRCDKTAEIIKRQTSSSCITHSTLLGNPGAYIKDEKLAGATFESLSVFDVVAQHLSGRQHAGFCSPAEGSQLLMNEMLADLKQGYKSLYVSHDVILASFIGNMLKLEMGNQCWVDYLEGFTVTLLSNGALQIKLLDRGVAINE